MKYHLSNRNYKCFDLEKLRKIDFTRFIDTQITKIGDKRRTLCPFHPEDTASFFIYPNNGFYCFGCGVSGSGAIDFLIKKFNYSFKYACKILEEI